MAAIYEALKYIYNLFSLIKNIELLNPINLFKKIITSFKDNPIFSTIFLGTLLLSITALYMNSRLEAEHQKYLSELQKKNELQRKNNELKNKLQVQKMKFENFKRNLLLQQKVKIQKEKLLNDIKTIDNKHDITIIPSASKVNKTNDISNTSNTTKPLKFKIDPKNIKNLKNGEYTLTW